MSVRIELLGFTPEESKLYEEAIEEHFKKRLIDCSWGLKIDKQRNQTMPGWQIVIYGPDGFDKKMDRLHGPIDETVSGVVKWLISVGV